MVLRGGATFDAIAVYRYRLWREWDASQPRICFVMLNPSTADAMTDDPTIRRCLGFARTWGFGSLDVVNLFALRARRPTDLHASAFDPVGPDNDRHLVEASRSASRVVAAWGMHGTLQGRDRAVQGLLPTTAVCFGRTRAGQPLHPLYLAASARAIWPLDGAPVGAAAGGDLHE